MFTFNTPDQETVSSRSVTPLPTVCGYNIEELRLAIFRLKCFACYLATKDPAWMMLAPPAVLISEE